MGIEISGIDEANLLAALGEADWVIALPNDLPDLVVSVEWRQALIDSAGREFVRWVRRGQDIQIHHDDDPVWDSSGTARQFQADPLILLTRHETLKSWLGEYTGNNRATYLAGMGLAWLTYEDEIGYNIWSGAGDLLRQHVQQAWGYAEDTDVWEDPRWSALELIEIQLCWALGQIVGMLSTTQAWERYQPDIVFDEEEQRLRAEAAQMLHLEQEDMVAGFWEQHFSHLDGQRVEKSQFLEQEIHTQLEILLADTDPDVVEAIAQLGLPGDFSDSVQEAIRAVARQALI